MCVLICIKVFEIFLSNFCIAIFIPLKIVENNFDVNCSFIGFFFFFFFLYLSIINYILFVCSLIFKNITIYQS